MLILKMCLSPVGFEGKLCLDSIDGMSPSSLIFWCACGWLLLNLPQTALCFRTENCYSHLCLDWNYDLEAVCFVAA